MWGLGSVCVLGGGMKCNGSVWPRTELTFGIDLCMVSIYNSMCQHSYSTLR